MSDLLLAFAIKLPLALAVFLLIAYAGTINQRIAGVLFTFPILNGVAIIASPDPIAVADAIYPLVIFNCVLFAVVISFPRRLPPIGGALSRGVALFARVLTWSVAWFAGAFVLTLFHHSLPGGAVLLAGATVFALAFMLTVWTPHGATAEDVRRTGFLPFWANRTGVARILFFCLAYAVLVSVSRHALDEKWVGMASALPLPGFFALATLIERGEGATVRPIRDTLFLGPVLVIPFNWAFSHLLVSWLAHDATMLRYLLLFALWAVAALAVLMLVPRIAAYLDRRS
jgi:hypothetical protein